MLRDALPEQSEQEAELEEDEEEEPITLQQECRAALLDRLVQDTAAHDAAAADALAKRTAREEAEQQLKMHKAALEEAATDPMSWLFESATQHHQSSHDAIALRHAYRAACLPTRSTHLRSAL